MNKKIYVILTALLILFVIYSGGEKEQVKSKQNTTHSPITYLKKEPSFDSVHLQVIEPGVELKTLDSKNIDGFKWWKIEYDGKVGWITEELLNKK